MLLHRFANATQVLLSKPIRQKLENMKKKPNKTHIPYDYSWSLLMVSLKLKHILCSLVRIHLLPNPSHQGACLEKGCVIADLEAMEDSLDDTFSSPFHSFICSATLIILRHAYPVLRFQSSCTCSNLDECNCPTSVI